MTELELRSWLAKAPRGTLVPADALAQALPANPSEDAISQQALSWRERLWLAPPDTRLGVAELLEALGRTRSWLYRHTGPNSPCSRIPHRKLDGELLFLAGEVRHWLAETEQIIVGGHSRPAELVPSRRPRLQE